MLELLKDKIIDFLAAVGIYSVPEYVSVVPEGKGINVQKATSHVQVVEVLKEPAVQVSPPKKSRRPRKKKPKTN